MSFDRLTALLLERAIRGELVPQLDSEPAVEQIGEAPKDVPFAIPEKWKWVRLKAVCEKITDGTHRSPKNYPKGDPRGKHLYVTAKNIKFTGVDLSTATYVSEEDHKEIISRCFPEYGDILFIKDGATTGVVTVNDLKEEFSLLSSVALIKANRDRLDSKFLVFVLRSGFLMESVRKSMKGTAISRVTLKIINEFAIPLPPIEEQHRITRELDELLGEVNRAKESYDDLCKYGENLRKKILQEAVCGALVPQFDAEPAVEQLGDAPADVPFEIPEKWKWVRLQDVSTINPRVKPRDDSDVVSFIPMASVSAGYDGKITIGDERVWSSVKNGYTKFSNGDVILAKITPCFQNRKSAVANNLKNGIGCGSSEFHVIRASADVDPEYVLMFLKSEWFIRYGMDNFKGTAGQQRLGTNELKTCPFPLPPLPEQRRIIAKSKKMFGEVNRLLGQ